jgi:hypothetical protein
LKWKAVYQALPAISKKVFTNMLSHRKVNRFFTATGVFCQWITIVKGQKLWRKIELKFIRLACSDLPYEEIPGNFSQSKNGIFIQGLDLYALWYKEWAGISAFCIENKIYDIL